MNSRISRRLRIVGLVIAATVLSSLLVPGSSTALAGGSGPTATVQPSGLRPFNYRYIESFRRSSQTFVRSEKPAGDPNVCTDGPVKATSYLRFEYTSPTDRSSISIHSDGGAYGFGYRKADGSVQDPDNSFPEYLPDGADLFWAQQNTMVGLIIEDHEGHVVSYTKFPNGLTFDPKAELPWVVIVCST